jgi:hypothetical protein
VPAGTRHAIWNEGPGRARATWETRPALRTEEFFATAWGLARDGKVDKRGVPGLLQAAAILREYRNEFQLAKPPGPVQRIVFVALAPVARLRGHRGRYAAQDSPA